MKKIFLTLVAVVTFTISTSAQYGEQATQVSNSCGMSGCFYVQLEPTGSLSVDISIAESTNGTFRRPLNFREAIAVANAMEELC